MASDMKAATMMWYAIFFNTRIVPYTDDRYRFGKAHVLSLAHPALLWCHCHWFRHVPPKPATLQCQWTSPGACLGIERLVIIISPYPLAMGPISLSMLNGANKWLLGPFLSVTSFSSSFLLVLARLVRGYKSMACDNAPTYKSQSQLTTNKTILY